MIREIKWTGKLKQTHESYCTDGLVDKLPNSAEFVGWDKLAQRATAHHSSGQINGGPARLSSHLSHPTNFMTANRQSQNTLDPESRFAFDRAASDNTPPRLKRAKHVEG